MDLVTTNENGSTDLDSFVTDLDLCLYLALKLVLWANGVNQTNDNKAALTAI